jgi:hypothetical protein
MYDRDSTITYQERIEPVPVKELQTKENQLPKIASLHELLFRLPIGPSSYKMSAILSGTALSQGRWPRVRYGGNRTHRILF